MSNGTYAIKISRCTNVGTVDGGTNIGGIIGKLGISENDNIDTIEYCINAGFVNGIHSVGGILGLDAGYNDFIRSCLNVGVVIGLHPAATTGAILGEMANKDRIFIMNCIYDRQMFYDYEKQQNPQSKPSKYTGVGG